MTSKKSKVRKDREVLNVERAAALLGVSKRLIYTLAQTEDLTGRKIGREWRFTRTNVLQWLNREPETSSLETLIKQGKRSSLGRGSFMSKALKKVL